VSTITFGTRSVSLLRPLPLETSQAALELQDLAALRALKNKAEQVSIRICMLRKIIIVFNGISAVIPSGLVLDCAQTSVLVSCCKLIFRRVH
jgi:hypothetical protein